MYFFDGLLPAVLRGDKTITIRRQTEHRYLVGSRLKVHSHTTKRWLCDIEITAVEALCFQDLNHTHAEREQMALPDLKKLIAEIYPGTEHLIVISFKLIQ